MYFVHKLLVINLFDPRNACSGDGGGSQKRFLFELEDRTYIYTDGHGIYVYIV